MKAWQIVSGLILGHDASVGETAPDPEHDHVAQTGRLNQLCAGEQGTQIALLVAVQHPVAGVGSRVERLDKPEVAIDAHQEHGAVDAHALEVGRVMVGCADPGARGDDDGATLRRLGSRR